VYSQENNSTTARTMSLHYSARTASLSLLPSTPPLVLLQSTTYQSSPRADHISRHCYGRKVRVLGMTDSIECETDSGQEEFAREFEGHVPADPPYFRHTSTPRQSMHDIVSDPNSELELPTLKEAFLNETKRISDTAFSPSEGPERYITSGGLSVVGRDLTTSVNSRSKFEQTLQHDLSGLVPQTPKLSRKKSDYKRTHDHQLPDHVDHHCTTHVGAFASASVAPGISRPASPAHSVSVVYELGDIIPPLRRAKKVDEPAMMKRIRALEESQRKAWTNIARRDVAKVRRYAVCFLFVYHLVHSGVQVSCRWLPNKVVPVRTLSKARHDPSTEAV
jgi:DNA helicase INO80